MWWRMVNGGIVKWQRARGVEVWFSGSIVSMAMLADGLRAIPRQNNGMMVMTI